MAMFAISLAVDDKVREVVKEFNERLTSGSNPSLVFFMGKASLIFERGEPYIFFNVRVNPFEPPLYKRILFVMFKRALKKKGYKHNKPKLLSNKDLSKVLEGYLWIMIT